MTKDPRDARGMWQRDLQRGPTCVLIDRIGGDLSNAERAHLDSCARCQAERALWQSFDRDEPMRSAEDEARVAWIAAEAQRRVWPTAQAASLTAVPRWQAARWLALAAGIVLVASAALLWRDRAPSIGPPPDPAGAYRSGTVELRLPMGDLVAPPTDFSWAPVERAASYEVRLMEIDGNVLWSTTTTAPHQPAPDNIREWAMPMKTLLWDVTARDPEGTVLARSETGRFRVTGKSVAPGM